MAAVKMEREMIKVVKTAGAIRCDKLQSSPTNHPDVYRPDALPVAKPIVSHH